MPKHAFTLIGLFGSADVSANQSLRLKNHPLKLDRLVWASAFALYACLMPLGGLAQSQSSSATILLGTQTIQSQLGSDPIGEAQAFPITALASGTLGSLTVYLDASSNSTQIYLGVYADASGHPGALLAQGSNSQLREGAWNTLSISSVSIQQGTKYWIAILGTQGGAPQFRDNTASGSCQSETSSQLNLTSLPAKWSTGQIKSGVCNLSAYGSGQATGGTTVTVTFDNPAPSGSSGSLLNGIFQGINFGTGNWDWEGPWASDPSNNIYFSSQVTSRQFTFSPGPMLLVSLHALTDVNGTLTLTDNLGQTKSQAITTGSMQLVTTGWTKASTTVTVSFTAGMDLAIDDITYGSPSGSSSSQSSSTLSASPTSLNFGNVTVGASSTQKITVTNPGPSSVKISQASISGTGFSLSGPTLPLTLSASQSTTFTVTFAPKSAGSATGSLVITSNASNSSLTIPLSGTGVTATTTTTTVTFDNPAPSGSPGPLNGIFQGINFGTGNWDWEGPWESDPTNNIYFSAQVNSRQFTFSPGPMLLVSLHALTDVNGTLTLTDNLGQTKSQAITTGSMQLVTTGWTQASTTVTVSFTAGMELAIDDITYSSPSGSSSTQSAMLTETPTSTSFGNVLVGSTSTLPVLIKNTGTASATLSAMTLTGTGFSVTGLSLPYTLPAGQSMSYSVTFAPKSAGSVTGSITITSNAADSPNVETLSGTGTNAHSVSLSWTASTSTNISGYNVYRSNTSGGPYTKVNGSLITSTSYTDTTVQAGQTYYYVATAVNTSNVESSYSNQAQATVPSP
jgi:hypothetical protein